MNDSLPRIPADPRIPVARDLMHRIGADAVVVHGLRRAPPMGVSFFTDVVVVGADPIVASMSGMEGFIAPDLGIDLSATHAIDAFSFSRVEDLSQEIVDGMWKPLNIHDSMGALIEEDGAMAVAVSPLRCKDRPIFNDIERRRANAYIDDFRHAAQQRVAPFHDAPALTGTALFHPGGTLAYCTEELSLAAPLLKEVGAEAVRFATHGTPGRCQLGPYAVELTTMAGSAGRVVAVSIRYTEPLPIPPVMRLTPVKRQVVAYAVEGATVPEIAATMHRSPETVRAHLKQIYETLGVSSRVDLAEACRGFWR